LDGRKINVKLIDAYIYHYGWVKPPKGIENKLRNFNQFYHDEQWIAHNIPETFTFDYGNADKLIKFKDTHPAVMQKRIAASNWKLNLNAVNVKWTMRRRFLQTVELLTGWRIGEYRNYKIIKK
jgi:hypothetical protein